MLHNELEFFIANQDNLVDKYRGKILVIHDQKITGIFDRLIDAYLEGQKHHELGTFLIQPCEPGPDAYTATISTQGLIPSAA